MIKGTQAINHLAYLRSVIDSFWGLVSENPRFRGSDLAIEGHPRSINLESPDRTTIHPQASGHRHFGTT